ncbi:hypothetical protein BAUCODRAFT_33743 [Baudoinia panamericana UAMH 10762]|uniref:Ketoreductase (KR) domain-containing protein n=1 Tax=Baudoinia panamericana (strain UAMH 10762) TaxID=717646 RepID=M2NC02_BAUPA|nr:uncharacterized protein BAUCODRAFT_33743 [Baudoinia panamericana UAMH 10762]EMC96415.1 hypothetical protein BAUCODRAFT_33743 [Baudoinia panamericana UAMH 10762]
MVSLSEVRSSNAALPRGQGTLTAVFVGATSGIGLATLRSYATHISNPTALIIGRNRSKFASELGNLRSLNPAGSFTFLEADVSLIKNIDAVCESIKQQLSGAKVDLVYLSQGYVGFNGRETNAEGLDNSFSLRYYGRIRFASRLAPLLTPNGRVVSVLGGGQEGKMIEDDLDLERNYSVGQAMVHSATLHSLSFDQLAKQYPDKAFIHAFPGLASTGLLGHSATGVLGVAFKWIVEPLMSLFVAKPADVGERMLYYGTAPQFQRGSWTLNEKGEAKEVAALKEYREKGWAEKVGEFNVKMFERALQV